MTERAFHNRRRGDWLQNLLLSASVMLLGWTIQQLFGLSAMAADFQPRISAVEIQVSSAYRASDARRDYAEFDKRLTRLEGTRWKEGHP